MNKTPDVASILLDRFSNNNPYYALAWKKAGEVGYKPVRRRMTKELLQQHLAGKITLGAYQLNSASLVNWIGWDIDSSDHDVDKTREYAQTITDRLGDIPYGVENSGNKGYHVLVFLTHPMNAGKAKQIAEAVRGNLPASGTTHVECFPKQAKLTQTSRMGSLIKIPLCIHPKSNRRSMFVNSKNGWKEIAPLPILTALVEPSALEALLDGRSPSPKPAGTYTPLGQPLTPGNRNESVFHNALVLARQGEDYDVALKTLQGWAKDQPDYHDVRVEEAVKNAFKLAAETKGKAKEFLPRGEHGDAELFALMFRDRVIFDHAAKAWFIWFGNCWYRDFTKDVNELVANELAEEYYRAAVEESKADQKELSTDLFKRAHALRQKHRIDNVLSLASGIPGMKLVGDEWDTNPMLLGVNNGVIDLATGEFRTGAPREYLRAHCPTDWRGIDCPAPMWEKFLLGITEDQEMVDFMQRLFGYCITGLTTDHIFPVLWGEHGFNGKGTLLETLANVLGKDLAMPTPAETVMVKQHSSGSAPNTALMAFQGKRLIWASESKEGHRLDSAMVKQMTGGDTITGNEKFERQKTFKATHKIMLMTNHKPHIKADDQALLDRLLTLDFQLHFCDEPKKENERKIDRNLPAKLEAEASGILAWLVRGCLEWQAGGLRPTTRVKDANAVYKIEEDDMGEFILEELVAAPGKTILASEVYRVYKAWANKNGMNPMSSQAFSPKLEDKFGKRIGTGGKRAYVGIELAHLGAETEIDLER